jgi:hypothetical protein
MDGVSGVEEGRIMRMEGGEEMGLARNVGCINQ